MEDRGRRSSLEDLHLPSSTSFFHNQITIMLMPRGRDEKFTLLGDADAETSRWILGRRYDEGKKEEERVHHHSSAFHFNPSSIQWLNEKGGWRSSS